MIQIATRVSGWWVSSLAYTIVTQVTNTHSKWSDLKKYTKVPCTWKTHRSALRVSVCFFHNFIKNGRKEPVCWLSQTVEAFYGNDSCDIKIPAYHFHHFTLILVIVTASTTPQLNSVMSTPDPLLRLLAVRHHTLVASHSMSAWGHIWVIQCYYSQDLFNSSTHSSWRTLWDFHSYQIIFLSIKAIRAVFQDVSHKRRS